MDERLTARSPKNGMAYLVGVKNDEQGLEGSYNTLKCVQASFEALATYEETGFSPDEITILASENTGLKLQLEKVIEALGIDGLDTPCPSNVGLTDTPECGIATECRQCWQTALEGVKCWREALETVGKGEVKP